MHVGLMCPPQLSQCKTTSIWNAAALSDGCEQQTLPKRSRRQRVPMLPRTPTLIRLLSGLALVTLQACASATSVASTSPTATPSANLVDERKVRLEAAAARCKAGEDTGCADLLRDPEVWQMVWERADVPLMQRACTGGLDTACDTAEEFEKAMLAPKADPDALLAQMEALGRLQTLSDRYVQQLDVLAKVRCASGASEKIAAEWRAGDGARAGELKDLDDRMALLLSDGDSMTTAWTTQRKMLDRRLKLALERAVKCEEMSDDDAKDWAGAILLAE